jgi:hypothetical protein
MMCLVVLASIKATLRNTEFHMNRVQSSLTGRCLDYGRKDRRVFLVCHSSDDFQILNDVFLLSR